MTVVFLDMRVVNADLPTVTDFLGLSRTSVESLDVAVSRYFQIYMYVGMYDFILLIFLLIIARSFGAKKQNFRASHSG